MHTKRKRKSSYEKNERTYLVVQLLSHVCLWPHGLQLASLPRPSLSPGVCSNSHPLNQWCHPAISSSVVPFSSCLQSFSASGSFLWVGCSHQVAKFWSFSFSISPSNKYSRLISFRIDWFALLGVQRTFKSLLQHHSSKGSILWHAAFFRGQVSQPYMTTGKTLALTRWNFVDKVMYEGAVWKGKNWKEPIKKLHLPRLKKM